MNSEPQSNVYLGLRALEVGYIIIVTIIIIVIIKIIVIIIIIRMRGSPQNSLGRYLDPPPY